MDTDQAPYGRLHRKDDHLRRLRRIEGQARGLQRMVEDEPYRIDIVTQVSAMTKALQSIALGLVEEHLSRCVVDAARAGGSEADAQGPRDGERDRPAGPLLTNARTGVRSAARLESCSPRCSRRCSTMPTPSSCTRSQRPSGPD